MALEPKLREMLRGAGIDPDVMREVAVWTDEGRQAFITFDEREIDRRLQVLRESLGDDAPARLRRGYNEVAAYHFARRQTPLALPGGECDRQCQD